MLNYSPAQPDQNTWDVEFIFESFPNDSSVQRRLRTTAIDPSFSEGGKASLSWGIMSRNEPVVKTNSPIRLWELRAI